MDQRGAVRAIISGNVSGQITIGRSIFQLSSVNGEYPMFSFNQPLQLFDETLVESNPMSRLEVPLKLVRKASTLLAVYCH